MTASVIIPCTVSTPFLKYTAEVAVRTCRASTDAEILVLCNNSPDLKLREEFERNCRNLAVNYSYWDDAWNMNRFFNRGMNLSSGDYIALCNQDVIFFPDWFHNLIGEWQREPDYFLLMPFTFGMTNTAFMRNPPNLGVGIRPCHDVTSGVTVFIRGTHYRYDEQFSDLEQDTDLQWHCEKHGLKRGVALSSRVDHIFETVRHEVNMDEATGIPDNYKKANAAVRAKWGKP